MPEIICFLPENILKNSTVYRVTVEGEITKIFSLDPEFVNYRYVERMFTHASVSCDKKKRALDMQIADTWYIGYGDLETGKVTILDTSGRCYNYAQFSPRDPDVFLLNQDWWRDSKSGEYMGIKNRMWLAYELTGNETGKKAALMAADHLCGRFQEVGQFIQYLIITALMSVIYGATITLWKPLCDLKIRIGILTGGNY